MKRVMVTSLIMWIAACGGTVTSGDQAAVSDSGAGGSAGHGGSTAGSGGWAAGSGGWAAGSGGWAAGSGGWAAGSGGTSVGAAAGTGGNGLGASAGMGGSPSVGGSAGTPGTSQCGGGVCKSGELCCYATAQCFDPVASPDACPKAPPPAADAGPWGNSCYSDVDCGPGTYCSLQFQFTCFGVGVCDDKSMCGFYSKPACGCDGQVHDFHEACSNGVQVIISPCGAPATDLGSQLIPCGNSSAWCPAGQICCGITGYCYDQGQPLLCTVPPTGTYFPCMHDGDCPFPGDFCQGPTCGAPGGCKKPGDVGECTGQWDPVCGCDSKTYVNEDCATKQGIATAYKGQCTGG